MDARSRHFRTIVRLEDWEGKDVQVDLVARDGGWRYRCISDDTDGLAGRYDLPQNYLATMYRNTWTPDQESGFRWNKTGQDRLRRTKRFETAIQIGQYSHGFLGISRVERETRSRETTQWGNYGIGYARDGALSVLQIGCESNTGSTCGTQEGALWPIRIENAGTLVADWGWGHFVWYKE